MKAEYYIKQESCQENYVFVCRIPEVQLKSLPTNPQFHTYIFIGYNLPSPFKTLVCGAISLFVFWVCAL
jgi:hypothetical protein